MGSTDRVLIANLDKRQYIDPTAFNDYSRLNHFLIGNHARAVALLVCDGGPGAGAGQLWDRWAGSWSRDRIVGTTDASPPNTHGIQTATPENPDRNLFNIVFKEFEDISYPMLIVLCESDREFADALLDRTSTKNLPFLWHIGNALSLYPCTSLEQAVVKRFGPDWKRLYHEQDIEEQRFAAMAADDED